LEDNKFLIIITAICVIAVSLLRILDYSSYKKNNSFPIFCFDGQLVLDCEESKEIGNVCSKKAVALLEDACRKLEAAGLKPLQKTEVAIIQLNKCSDWLEKNSACFPFFYWKGEKKGIGFLSEVLDDPEACEILGHELGHAIFSKKRREVSRLVAEFFAVYVEIAIGNGDTKRYLCAENGNQSALSTIEGEYGFPISKEHPAMYPLSLCRYGQLAFISRQLQKKYPDFFNGLVKKLDKHGNTPINLSLLHKWAKEIDQDAEKYLSEFYVLKNSDGLFHVGGVPFGRKMFFFAIRPIDAKKEVYIVSAPLILGVKYSYNSEIVWKKYEIENELAVIDFRGLKSGEYFAAGIPNPDNAKSGPIIDLLRAP